MPRFVLLYHDCPPHYRRRSHWDFMLETGQSLRTWGLAQLPREWTVSRARTAIEFPDCPRTADETTVEAVQLDDHRIDYLGREGALSENRGCVRRVDAGTYDCVIEAPDHLEITLAGENWSGGLVLQQIARNEARWTLTIERASV
jgi:hypothetical protein